MLTGKALNDFKTWIVLKSDDPNVWVTDKISVPFEELNEVFQIALILEWFDEEGLNILLTCEYDFGYQILEDRYGVEEEVKKWYDTRDEASKAAIKKANEIYNKK